jgi:hypothetical protein
MLVCVRIHNEQKIMIKQNAASDNKILYPALRSPSLAGALGQYPLCHGLSAPKVSMPVVNTPKNFNTPKVECQTAVDCTVSGDAERQPPDPRHLGVNGELGFAHLPEPSKWRGCALCRKDAPPPAPSFFRKKISGALEEGVRKGSPWPSGRETIF